LFLRPPVEFLTAKDSKVADAVRLMRNHGLIDRDTASRFGAVSRLDTLQAIILAFRLTRLPSIIERRRANAARYGWLLDPNVVFLPPERQHEYNTHHTLVVQVDYRDELQAHLSEIGVGTAIHYPIPIHLQPAAAGLGLGKGSFPACERQAERILTLPVHPWLSEDDIDFICSTVNAFLRARCAGTGMLDSRTKMSCN
jgi:dTDP-4-amino-4,6-dideoxygalactose transaminase